MTLPTLVLLLVSVSPLTLQKIYFSIFFFLFWLHMLSCAMTKHHQSWFLERGSQWRSSSSSSPRAQHGVKRLKTFSLPPLSEGSPAPINILKAKLPACFGAQSPLGPRQLLILYKQNLLLLSLGKLKEQVLLTKSREGLLKVFTNATQLALAYSFVLKTPYY